MTHEHTPTCDELQDILRELRAQTAPPQRTAAMPGFQSAVVVETGDRAPEATREVDEQISSLRQRLRDMGCDRDG